MESLHKRARVDWDQSARRHAFVIMVLNACNIFEALRIRTVCRELHNALNDKHMWIQRLTYIFPNSSQISGVPKTLDPQIPICDFIHRNVILNYKTAYMASLFDALGVTQNYHYVLFWLLRRPAAMTTALVEQINRDGIYADPMVKIFCDDCARFSYIINGSSVALTTQFKCIRSEYRQAYQPLIEESMLLHLLLDTIASSIWYSYYKTPDVRNIDGPLMSPRDIFILLYSSCRNSKIFGKSNVKYLNDMKRDFDLDMIRLTELIKTRPTKIPGGSIEEPIYMG